MEGALSLFSSSDNYPKTQIIQRFNKDREFQINFPREQGLKIPNEILENWIQKYTKKITHHDHMGFLQRCRDSSTYDNLPMIIKKKTKEKKDKWSSH